MTGTACILACLALPTALALAPSGLGSQPQKSRLARSIDDYLERCEAHGWSGTVLVAKGQKVVLAKGYGFAHRQEERKNTANTLFEIASATKPFTACAIMKLVEQSKVKLEDPISKYLPGVPKDKDDITVRHLLTHSSGMPRSAAAGGGEDLKVAVQAYLAPDRPRGSGVAHEYWNGGYALLAGIVEVASGKSYQAYCQEHLFTAASMEQTGFAGDRSLSKSDQAVGYSGDKAVRYSAEHAYGSYGYEYRGMGGLVTNVHDLWRFIGSLDAGRILERETVALMGTAAIEFRGLGWAVTETQRKTRRIGHGGDVRGFHAKLNWFPDDGAAVIVLSNVDGVPLHAISGTLESMLFGGTVGYPSPPEIAELKDRDLDKLVGTYRLEKGEGRMVVERRGNALSISRTGEGAAAGGAGESGPSGGSAIEAGLEKETSIAKGIVSAVERGDAEWIGNVLMVGIPASWPALLVSTTWPKHVAEHGPLTGTKVVAAKTIGKGRVEVICELSHGKGTRPLKVVLQDQRLNIFDLAAGLPDAAETYRPVSKTEFTTFEWLGRPGPQSVVFDVSRRKVKGLDWRPRAGAALRYVREGS